MNDQFQIINAIKAEKNRQKMTLQTLSQLSGIPQGTLNRLMSRNNRSIKTDQAVKLAQALNISFSKLIGNSKPCDNQPVVLQQPFLGYVKVSASTTSVKVADVDFNVQQLSQRLTYLNNLGVKLVVFPELCLTAYTCGDLFYQQMLQNKTIEGIAKLVEHSKNLEIVFAVGAPLKFNGLLYNTAVVIFNGKILGIVPKSYLPNYNEFYEKRQFAPAPADISHVSLCGQTVPFGTNILFRNKSAREFTFACEICEDFWVSTPPSARHTRKGANIVLNLSASNESVGKASYRRSLVSSWAARTVCGYLYASAGDGESTTDTVFSGHNIVAEYKNIVAETPLFSATDALAEIDLMTIENQRQKVSNFSEIAFGKSDYFISDFELPLVDPSTLIRKISQTPFVSADKEDLNCRCRTILDIQSEGLKKRITHINAQKLVLGVSGGLDSTLALVACVKTMQKLKRPASDIIAVTMPSFGTTERTKNNAVTLAKLFGTTVMEIDIKQSVLQHFADINHDSQNIDTVFENAQARERTQILMDLANKHNGIVVGTGNLSEIALGWSTFNGDHMSMYSVNCSVPKTLIKHILHYVANEHKGQIKTVLSDIIDTPISPELVPPQNGQIVQKTEQIVGPYILHDFFLFHFLRSMFPTTKILFLAEQAFEGVYDSQTLKKWLNVFVKRFFAQQFKRNCAPDGVKVGSVCLSARSDWRMPSDANPTLWLVE